MNPTQALTIIAQAAAQAPLPLAAHQQVGQAFQVLQKAITPPAPAPQPTPADVYAPDASGGVHA